MKQLRTNKVNYSKRIKTVHSYLEMDRLFFFFSNKFIYVQLIRFEPFKMDKVVFAMSSKELSFLKLKSYKSILCAYLLGTFFLKKVKNLNIRKFHLNFKKKNLLKVVFFSMPLIESTNFDKIHTNEEYFKSVFEKIKKNKFYSTKINMLEEKKKQINEQTND